MVCVCVGGGVKLLSLFLKISFFLSDILERCFFFHLRRIGKKRKKSSSAHLPTFQRTKPQNKSAKKVKNVSQFERWSDDSHAIERTRDVENTRQENSKVNPFARCIERDRG